DAHALEKEAIRLLEAGRQIAGDTEIAAIYSAHLVQTKRHEVDVAARLEAHGESPSRLKDMAMQAAALGAGALVGAMPDTPMRLAVTAFAFENLEVATYRVLQHLARRADDAD